VVVFTISNVFISFCPNSWTSGRTGWITKRTFKEVERETCSKD